MTAERTWARIAIFVALAAVVATATNCHTHPWPYQNTITVGQSLTTGQYIASSTSYLTVSGGSAVLYRGTHPSTSQQLWTTGTTTGVRLTLEPSGNLVLYSSSSLVVWQSGSNTPAEVFVLQDDCNGVLYTQAPYTNSTWATGTQVCVVAHIVPHSHDDVGWLLTPERYYDGCYDPTGGVQSIISSMVAALTANSSRTFAQVESYYFNRWWERQSAATKAATRAVVLKGQFDFINAGWSMHDEACVHQESAVSNMEVGAQFLRNEFGQTMNLTIGWHIDPFGHASATPRLMSQMGFDAFFFQRVDYEYRQHMMNTKTLETMWNPSPSLGDNALMFTSIMYQGYCSGCTAQGQSGFVMCPSPFCCMTCEHDRAPHWTRYFEQLEASKKRQTSIAEIRRTFHVPANSTQRDVFMLSTETLATSYANYLKGYAGSFRTNQVLVPWGCDFEHIDASISFALMDSVMTEINGNPGKYGVHMFYSTPERYVKKVASMNYAWPTNDYDYFLDSDDGHSYWSGYFSSRAEYKRFERFTMNQRVASEIAMSAGKRTDFSKQRQRLDTLRQALGVAQHHDSITGTEREHVRNRYHLLLTEALNNASATVNDIFSAATGAESAWPCMLSNLSSCDLTTQLAQGKTVTVLLYNGLAWPRTEIVTIPVPITSIGVFNKTTPLVSQVAPTWELTTSRNPTSPPHTTQPFELVFAVTLPPLALVPVQLVAKPTTGAATVVTPMPGSASISNNHYVVAFNNATNRIRRITNKDTQISSTVDQNFLWYCPMGPEGGQASGAYIFRTCVPNAVAEPFNNNFQAVHFTGPVCSEVRQTIDPTSLIYQTVRLCQGQDYVDLQSGAGPVDPGNKGREVIMRISTDVDSQGEFFTDSQGLELQRRVRNSHPNYPYTVTEPIAANFYPCNVFSMIADPVRSLAVVADYSRSTSSIIDGSLEFLYVRRLLYDDHRGVGEPLNESIRVISSSRLIVNADNALASARKHAVLHTHPPLVRYAPTAVAVLNPAFAAQKALPPQLTLHTRTLLQSNLLLLRLQHIYFAGESSMSVPVTVDVSAWLPFNAKFVSIVETDMNGIGLLKDANARRQQFRVCDATTGTSRMGPTPFASSIVSGSTVKIRPGDIRTYLIQFS